MSISNMWYLIRKKLRELRGMTRCDRTSLITRNLYLSNALEPHADRADRCQDTLGVDIAKAGLHTAERCSCGTRRQAPARFGGVEWTAEESALAEALTKTFPTGGGPRLPLGSQHEVRPISKPNPNGPGGASTDVGDVSWVVRLCLLPPLRLFPALRVTAGRTSSAPVRR